MIQNFALIGAAGYIAPRHMKAITETGNMLVAVLDKSDSVGVMDSYFPEAEFFTEFEQLDRHIDMLRRDPTRDAVDYVSICSPNYLHDSHMRFALRSDADAICEKPLVLNPSNIDGLIDVERDTGRKIHTILQLRLHPAIIAVKKEVRDGPADKKYDVDLTYVTSRGSWYLKSWKGDENKSGGIASNIGVHFFDMLQFIFGDLQDNQVHLSGPTRASGFLEFERARVRWFLSIDANDLPNAQREAGQSTFRSITYDNKDLEFSGGFTDLHTRSYEEILIGNSFGLDENRPVIEIVSAIRHAPQLGLVGSYHPFLREVMR